jgi:acyl-CoA hydrolase
MKTLKDILTKEKTVNVIANRELTYSFTVFPDDLNWAGTLFGGKLLAEMDLAAANTARRVLYGSDCNGVVTASLDKVDFKKPAHLGDIIEIRTWIIDLGRTSIRVKVNVTREDKQGDIAAICTADFTMVAVKSEKPYPHNCIL